MAAKIHLEWRPLWVRKAPPCPCRALEAQAEWKVSPLNRGLKGTQNVARDSFRVSGCNLRILLCMWKNSLESCYQRWASAAGSHMQATALQTFQLTIENAAWKASSSGTCAQIACLREWLRHS